MIFSFTIKTKLSRGGEWETLVRYHDRHLAEARLADLRREFPRDEFTLISMEGYHAH